ncbi:sushi, von Willebrand factor type A, EGF and pentraxin domain-containing protein 1-like [Mizuhopecten yessoensis]|uniref:sushi, von Willebrand factor type A, EGF and pentraxin domain-containing protein 1-like n=1 Tax=Mizuhopecten yessoensis TaxID=6573 RepID=UPI000B45E1F5|nr:sushi, von Willebrand factor type A, EGF and pentraxin domain-containing protein 1-like [Mizuhopecten yessoensis]
MHRKLCSVWRLVLLCALLEFKISRSYRDTEERRHNQYSSYMNSPIPQLNKNKVNTLGPVLKRHVSELRETKNKKVDIIFLVDSSSSVGPHDFINEVKFVRKLLADFTVDSNHTRVSVVTFSSKSRVLRQIDYIADSTEDKHKCSLLQEDIPKIKFRGGGTYTLGAFLQAKDILAHSRPDSKKAVFLITDGFSNGGDPRPQAYVLRKNGVKIFTFGIRNGNVHELYDMASEPKNETCYILDTFEEFESLARRALHEDLSMGTFMEQPLDRCSHLCHGAGACCDPRATCGCGTHVGQFLCVCQGGHYGTGLPGDCFPCPSGTYKRIRGPGDVTSCTTCPDLNHITEPGALSSSQCFCKKGFRSFNETGCSALTCPEMTPPKHGYFVNDKCNNVFNAACGMKCKPGYELRGSSLRICQEGGVWSGTPTNCIMKTCPALPRPKNGNMICSNDDFTFSTMCRFTCDTGYKLVGSRKRQCLANALWTGIPTRCREITCQPLPSVRDGNVFPAMCNLGEVSFGTTCQISCYAGYTLVGSSRKQCTPDGMWIPSMDGEMSRCDDTEPPLLRCPFNIDVEADDTEDSAEVDWIVPLALDNSGYRPSVTVVPAVQPPKRFPIGLTAVKYIAEDHQGNMAKCHFSVIIRDVTPPTVDQCYSPLPFVSAERYANVTWNEPQFSDNSGEKVRVERSHEPGLFHQGTTIVRYVAFDESGNNSTCHVEISIIPHPCQFPDVPLSGARECTEEEDGVYCRVTCNEGYDFAIAPADVYFCAYDNVWRPEDKLPIPDCSAKAVSEAMTQPASITYLASVPCAEHNVLNEIQLAFERKVTEKVNALCTDSFSCSVENFATTCEQSEDFNTIRVVLGRDKRSLLRTINPYTNHGHGDTRVAKRSSPGITTSSIITFDFDIKGVVSKTGNVTADISRQKVLTDKLSNVMTKLEGKATHGELDLEMSGKRMQFANMTYDAKGPRPNCKPGSVAVNDLCVPCPIGTFFNIVSEECDSCQTGSFQPKEGQVTCVVCPHNTSTHGNNSKSERECKALCLPGTFSKDGLERCATCPVGTYQTIYGMTSCDSCPNNQTTIRRGSRQVIQCKDRCGLGHVSKNGLEPCYSCPRGTYQTEVAMSSCFRCPGDGTTAERGTTKISDCQGGWDPQMQADDPPGETLPQAVPVNDCFDDHCQNGGTCNFRDFGFHCECLPGFEGMNCETVTDECEGNPCLNSALCVDLEADFSCQCEPGYTGKKCEVDIDDCLTQPCQNNGTCVDEVNAYVCSCATGYQGDACERLIDDCKTNPCENSGTCENVLEGYTCTCSTGYEGADCEINTDECESSPCENGAECVDGIGAFRCRCLPGYIGKTCDVDIDECASTPCSPVSTCEDMVDGYVCHCPSGVTGAKCETELTDNYMLDFPSSGVTNYTTTTINTDLTALTVSFWMKTDDDTNQGTPFSYSSSNTMDNAFTLTNYEGFVISVNNHQQVTDVYANDGVWHHIIVTWASNRGSWKIYKDGVVWDSGYDLAAGEVIAGGGTFVVGQEQDPEGFSSSESFIGQLTRLNIWSNELPLTTIDEMRISCDVKQGDVIAWADVQSDMRGTLSAEPANFCRDCPVPVTPTYGTIEYGGTSSGSIVSYACLRGFNVAGRDRRQCLVTGDWEGGRTPTCQRVECGYPGNIHNGFVDGVFSYDNRVRYTCYKNHILIGNATRYCNSDGYWEGSEPTCQAVKCRLPELSENTRVLNSSRVYSPGDVVAFGCAKGHRMYTNHSTVLCQSDGTFLRSIPSCDLQTCKTPPIVDKASPREELSESSVGSIVTYDCDFAYALSDKNPSGTLRCLPSGEWEQNLPVCNILTCQEPPNVINGRAIWTSRTFLSTAEYICDAGYTIIELDNIAECVETRLWEPPPPECIPVDCGVPDSVPNSIIKADSYTYRSIVTYQCNGGFELQGNAQRSCLQNGSWSEGIPTCSPASCGTPDSIENGRFVGNEFTYGSTVRYSCNDGFLMSGVEERACGQDGHWTSQIPSCRRRECAKPPFISNGFFTNSAYYFGDEVIYDCNEGYNIQGNTTLACQADGSWTPSPPTCSPVECPALRNIRNGLVTMLGRTFTSKVEYSCDPGYDLEGESIRICQPEGYWSGKSPSCQPGSCATPLPIPNGNVDFKELKLGSVSTYECDTGYVLEGNDVRRCMTTLSWFDTDPVCNPVRCSDPPTIENGGRSTNGLSFQSVASYFCETGYVIQGSTTLTCSASREWTGLVPSCSVVRCESPSTVTSNGRMHGTDFTYNGTIHYECDVGYNLVGAANRTCLSSGAWDTPIPICEIVNCNRAFLANGFPSSFRTEYGSLISFTCRSGYVLFGSSERTCRENGLWSGPSPVCVICDPPPAVDFATFTVFDDGVVTYECNTGYDLEGRRQLECRIDGIYPDRPPRCVPKECPSIDGEEEFQNGTITYDGKTVGSIASYTCDEGFVLVGSNTSRCLSDGRWSGNVQFCNIIRCAGSFSLQNGDIENEFNNVYETVLSFRCNEGFVMIGNSAITCQSDGTWNGTEPTCNQIECESPEKLLNGEVNFNSLAYGSVVTYTCETGFEANGTLTRICELNGNWSGVAPTCTAIACSPPQSIENGEILGNNYHLGSQIRYRCNSGFILDSVSFRLCMYSKMWSGPEPNCNKVRCILPRTPPNARITSPRQPNYFYGDTVQLECNEGYELTRGHHTRRCEATRKWSRPIPRCTIIMCDDIPAKPNAMTNLLNGTTTYKSMVEVRCNEGFKSIGGSVVTATCELSGRWSAVRIECSRAECEDLPIISNARVSGDSFLYGDTLTVECIDGYSINGDTQLSCQGDGSWWSAIAPTCSIISCGNPGEFENGQIEGSLFDFNHEIVYACGIGYELVGSERRTCQQNGLWSGSVPTCRLITCTVPAIWKGSPSSVKVQYVVDDIVSYNCDEGYVMVGNTDLVCTSDGSWNGTLPQCDRITCPQPERIFNGEVMTNGEVYQSRAIFSCDEGFELEGVKVLMCIENGKWSAEFPVCNPVSCGEPTFVANSGRLGDLYTYGNLLTYFCEDGYTLEGDDVLVCLEDATWSSFPPQCEPISCGTPPEIPQTIRAGDDFSFKNKVYYTCETGYELQGNSMLRCAANSIWEGSMPVCSAVDCGAPPVLPHSTTIVFATTFDSVVTFRCNPGFTLRGDPMVKCSANGTWSLDRSLSCLAVDCGPPPTVPNSEVSVSSTTYPSEATYSCAAGFFMSENAVLRCDETGNWIGLNPRCEKNSCGAPKIRSNVIVIGNDHLLGGTVTFSCPVGYILIGKTNMSCTSSGEWSGTSPECQVVSCGDFPLYDSNLIVRTGTKDEYVYADNIDLICKEGYVLVGTSSSQCQANGRWSAVNPSCIEANVEACPARHDLANANTIPSAYREGEMYTVECMTGYRGIGNMEVTCTPENVWSNPSGICRRISCGKPPVTDMVNIIRISGRSYFYGDRVQFRCRPGIAPIKVPPILSCQANGEWDGEIACSLPCKGGCFNGGHCLGLYGCKCPTGYGGRRCEKALCILPCLHGGRCTAPYQCSCPSAYTGVRCQKPICNQPCQNGGQCVKPNRCQCQHGFKPPFCAIGK